MSRQQGVLLKIGDQLKLSVNLNYDDLVILYKQFIETYNRVPSTNDGKSKYNLPQQRIIKKILRESNISYNDFIAQFGKYNHIRSSIENYDVYIKKYIDISNQLGRALYASELVNNQYGLPSCTWLVQNCPDKTVSSYMDFVKWCGFIPNKTVNTKKDVGAKLIELEEELNRPIVRADITKDKIGFSAIVINRLWGSLSKCKEELGLLTSISSKPKPFDYYRDNLLHVLGELKKQINRNVITWKDIESYPGAANHKAYVKSFNSVGVDIFAFIKQQGFLMNPSNFSYHFTFASGERVVSSMEYDFTEYINSLGYKYNIDYQRDYMYKKFIPVLNKTRINCDYYINNKVIEIAGIIHNLENNNWEKVVFSSKQEQDYQSKLLVKKELLESNNIEYLFLFPEDFYSNEYKTKFLDFI